MSEPPQSRKEPPRSAGSTSGQAIDATAARWVARRSADRDAADESELTAWRSRDVRHEEAFLRMSEVVSAFSRARQTGAAKTMMAELAVRDRQRSRRRLLSSAGLAAVLAIGVGIYFGASRRPERPAAARLASGFESVRLLPDGTIVELNANADLAVRFEPALRRVELRAGEALFHVAKNPARPFVVRAGGVDVRAVGTAFNVRLDASVVDVIVTEGKVGLEEAVHGASLLPAAVNGEHAPLVAGQRAMVENSRPGAVRITRVNPHEIERQLAWSNPRVEFDGIDLGFAVGQMNRRNGAHLELADASIAELRVSGTFPANDPGTFARLIAETFGLVEESRGDGVIVLRQP